MISLVPRGECQHDTDCPDNRACIENQCLDPCRIQDPCGKNANCQTSAHRPFCRCPAGWAGDPRDECFQCITIISLALVLVTELKVYVF